MQVVFIDIDNTLLDFDAYIRQTMRQGFAHFGLRLGVRTGHLLESDFAVGLFALVNGGGLRAQHA